MGFRSWWKDQKEQDNGHRWGDDPGMNEIEERLADAMDHLCIEYDEQYGLLPMAPHCRSKFFCPSALDWISEGWSDEEGRETGHNMPDGSKCSDVECDWWAEPYYKYRLDFAVIEDGVKLAIEVDGQPFHSAPNQLAADILRQRAIERIGWTFIRFTASDVYSHADRCARKVDKLLREMEEAQRQKQQGQLFAIMEAN